MATKLTRAPSGRPCAFTLVELLASMAIMGVLLGLLLPVLGRVSAAGRSTQCTSNLRQMVLAAHQYANTWDTWPLAVRYERVDGVVRVVAWDWVTTFDGELIEPGPLWAFTDTPDRVQQCPACFDRTNYGGDPYTGYNYNTTYVGGESRWPNLGWTGIRRGVPPHACARSSLCAMFGDGGWVGGTNKFMRAPLGSEPGIALEQIYAGAQAFRHGGATNVAYIDGHVAPVDRPCAGARATRYLLDDVLGHLENGFLSDDDRAYDPR